MKNASFQTDTTTASTNIGTVKYFDTDALVLTTAGGQGALSSVAGTAASSVAPSVATSSVVTVAGGANGAVTIRAGTTGAGHTLDVNQAIVTTPSAEIGGSVILEAGGAIATAAAGTITTTGGAGKAGGEVYIRHSNADAGAITVNGAIAAKGGSGAGGNGGVVTLLNAGGAIVVNAGVDVSKGGGTADGTIQLQANGSITGAGNLVGDTNGTLLARTTGTSGAQNISLTGNKLNVAGTNAGSTGNAMANAAFATATSGNGSITYYDSTGLTIGSVTPTGALVSPALGGANTAASLVSATSGIATVAGGATGAVVIAAGNTIGTGLGLSVTQAITTSPTSGAGGPVLLEADGTIALSGSGTLTTSGAGSGAGAGGEVFIHHTNTVGAGDITLGKNIVAQGSGTGNGAVVTVLNDSGNVLVNAGIDVSKGGGTDGTIQLKAAGNITETATGLLTGDTNGTLVVYSTGGKIDLSLGTNALKNATFQTDTAVGTDGTVKYYDSTDLTLTTGGGVGTLVAPSTINASSVALTTQGVKTIAGTTNGAVTIRAGTAGLGDLLNTAVGTILTTAAADSGAASGPVTLSANGKVALSGDITTTGATNGVVAGNKGGAVDITATGGTVTVTNITSSGGAATGGSIPGGNGGAISLTSTGAGSLITLNGNLLAKQGASSGSGAAATGGNITLNTDALLGVNVLVDAGSNTGNVSFGGKVDGAKTLTVNSGGTVTFTGAVGVGTPLSSLTTDALGATLVNGGAVRTSGAQTYGDPVIAKLDTTFTGVNVQFNSKLDSGTAGSIAVAVNDSGNTRFGGAVGTTTPLTTLTTDGAGTTTINSVDVRTTGTQTYNDVVTLSGGGTSVLDATNGGASGAGANITFTSTVTGTTALGDSLLIRGGTAGAVKFVGAVGATALGDVQVANAQSVVASSGITSRSLTTTTVQSQVQLDGAVAAAGNVSLTASGGISTASITTTAGGTVTFGNGGQLTIGGAITSDGALTQTGGNVSLGANVTTTSDLVSFGSAVALAGGARSIDTSAGGSGGDITFGSTLDGKGLDFTLSAGSAGNITFKGAISNMGAMNLSSVANLALLGGFSGNGLIQASGTGNTTLGGVIVTNGASGVQITTNGTIGVTGQVNTNNNPVTFSASNWNFGGSTINAGTQQITISQVANGTINMGSQLDTADLAALVTSSRLYIGGSSNTGIVNIDGSANFAASTPNVTLRATGTGGKITQTNSTAILGSPSTLFTLNADAGIGGVGAPIRFTGTDVSAVNATTGNLVLQVTSGNANLLEPFGNTAPGGLVDVWDSDGNLKTVGAVGSQGALALRTTIAGAPSGIDVGAAGIAARDSVTLQAANNIVVASGQGVKSTGGNVTVGTVGAAAGSGSSPVSAITIDAPVSAAGAVAVTTADGGIMVTAPVSAGTTLSMTANSAGAASNVNIGSSGVVSKGALALQAANNIVIAGGQGVKSTAGDVTLGAISVAGTRGGPVGTISIDGPVSAGGAVKVSTTDGSIATTAAVTAGGTLSMNASSTGAAANLTIGAAGAVSKDALTLQAANNIAVAGGQGVKSTAGDVTVSAVSAAAGAGASSAGSISIDGPMSAGGAAKVSTTDGSIATTAAISAGGTLSMSSNSSGAAATLSIGAGGVQAKDAVTLRAADALTLANGAGVQSKAGAVTVLAGNAAGMSLIGLTSLKPATSPGVRGSSAITIGAPVQAGGPVTIMASGPVTQATGVNAGLQSAGTAGNGGLNVVTFNDAGAPISLKNGSGSGAGICAGVTGSGNCAETLRIGTLFSDGRLTEFAAADIDYQGIGAISVQSLGTGADARVASASMLLPTSNIFARNASFWATAGNMDLSAQIGNGNINKGVSGGSLNLYAQGNVSVSAPVSPDSAGVSIGRRASVDDHGSVTAIPFAHELTLTATGDINITGSIYMAPDRDLSLRADASGTEVALTPGASALGDGAGSVKLATQPASHYGVNGSVYPLEVKARDIVVGKKVGSLIFPVQNLEISTSLPGLPADGSSQRADALLTASGNLDVYLTGDLKITAGGTQAVTTGATQKLQSTAVAAIEAKDVFIRGVGKDDFGALPLNNSSIFLTAGTAMANNGVGGDAFAAADAAIIASSTKRVDIGGDMWLQGGTTIRKRNADANLVNLVSAQAFLDPATMYISTGGSIVLIAGLGANASAKILNSGDIKFSIGGNAPVTFFNPLSEKQQTVPQGGLLLVGGPGSGVFDSYNNPIGLQAPPVEVSFYRGGGLTSLVASDRTMAPAYIQSGPTKNFDDMLLYPLCRERGNPRDARQGRIHFQGRREPPLVQLISTPRPTGLQTGTRRSIIRGIAQPFW